MTYLLFLSSNPALAWGNANDGGSFWMPPAVGDLAREIDATFYFIYWICVFFFIVLMGAMIYFAVVYRKKTDNDKTLDLKGSHKIELAWAIFPSFLLLAMFVMGFKAYLKSNIPPADALEVRVIGKQWDWRYKYPATGIESSILRVPLGKPVRLTMISEDVLHSYYIPDYRVKKDVIPGRFTVIWFHPDELLPARPNQGGILALQDDGSVQMEFGLDVGEHQVYCTEYCGDSHSRMLSKVIVQTPEDFAAWEQEQLNFDPSTLPMAEHGKWLFQNRACIGCHSIDGSASTGPTWKGAYGAQKSMVDGSSVTVDDTYIKESIVSPAAKIVTGYTNQMPGNYRQLLSDNEIDALIEFMKTLK